MIAKSKVFKLGGMLLRLVPPSMVVRVLSGINKGTKWVRGSANCPEWLGVYERAYQRLIRTVVTPGMKVCDIGANAGFFTLAFSRLVGVSGHVVAFEPVPANVAKIVTHVDLNHVTNVTIMPVAVGIESGFLPFAFGRSDFEGHLSTDGQSVLHVPVVTIDELVDTGRIPVPDVIKMDIEGGESDALRGARKTLQTGMPELIVALHGDDQRLECCELLGSLGFDITFFDKTCGPNTEIYAKKRCKNL